MTEFDQDAEALAAEAADVAESADAAEAADVAETAEAAEPADESAAPTDEAAPESPVSPEAAALARARAEHTLEQQLEALLIVADEPLGAVALATATDRPVAEVRSALARLVAEFNGAADGANDGSESGGARGPRGFELREVAGGYRFYVRATLDPLVADFVQQQTPSRLSQAALETLSVIAYRQPISRGAIASIRAVNVDSVVRTLLGRGLVAEVGHDPETGATLYGTSDALLGYLGIGDISELPPISPLLDDGSEGFDHEQL